MILLPSNFQFGETAEEISLLATTRNVREFLAMKNGEPISARQDASSSEIVASRSSEVVPSSGISPECDCKSFPQPSNAGRSTSATVAREDHSAEDKSGAAPGSGDGAEWTGAGGIGEDTGSELQATTDALDAAGALPPKPVVAFTSREVKSPDVNEFETIATQEVHRKNMSTICTTAGASPHSSQTERV
jgi:hypothetical protein